MGLNTSVMELWVLLTLVRGLQNDQMDYWVPQITFPKYTSSRSMKKVDDGEEKLGGKRK